MSSSGLFAPMELGGLKLKNRISMAPLYLGYANMDGTVSPLILDHYREMAASGAGLIVVENASVLPIGSGSPWTLRVDEDQFIEALSQLAQTIQGQGALAVQQINHVGRYSWQPDRVAPSPFETGGVTPREMTAAEIEETIAAYASAAARVKAAGYDGVEIHGGTGYLLVQFLSARTNQRIDAYGGSLENRMRFPLEVFDAVRRAVGPDYPVGYRFLSNELVPGGITEDETTVFAAELAKRNPAYLSVMAGTYDSFFLPEYLAAEKQEAYMAHHAGLIKQAVPGVPIIAAGRMARPETGEKTLADGQADVIGLARQLFADPLWPKKASGELTDPVVKCEPTCFLCMKRVMSGRPAFCSQWAKDRRDAFLTRVGDNPAETEVQ